MIIDCYYHFFKFFFIIYVVSTIIYIYKETCEILSYLFNFTIYLPVFVFFVVLLEVFSNVPSWRIENGFKCLYQIILVECHL